jgi:uncharacterized protein YfkK (UPF0435 family)
MIAAFSLVQIEMYFEKSSRSFHKLTVLSLAIIFIAVSLPTMQSSIRRILTMTNQIVSYQSPFNQTTYENLVFINKYIKNNDLIIADIETSWKAPSFSGKVIAALNPQAFIADTPDRERAIEAFFNTGTDKAKRLNILQQYRPVFLLLDNQHIESANIKQELTDFIQVIEQNEKYRLFKIQLP